ncbi:MAG: FadR family transcriptional regulator, partial [Verrucomicrobia bacterium]|nr:FadR family transcriptional regulator [Verrucomicrobiota bacterium]
PRRLYVQIADPIRSLIKAGEFPPGSRLPAERELARRLGVSRPSVREALIALEVEGHVDVRPGSGIVVTNPQGATGVFWSDEGPLEILQTRRLIEGEIAAEVAPAVRKKDIAALEQIMLRMEGAADGSTRLAADRQFHQYIAAKLANKVLLRLVTELFYQRDGPLARQFATHFDSAKTWAEASHEHRQIVAALAARDAEGARNAMRDHLRKAYKRWAQDLERGARTGARQTPRRRPSVDADGAESLARGGSGTRG